MRRRVPHKLPKRVIRYSKYSSKWTDKQRKKVMALLTKSANEDDSFYGKTLLRTKAVKRLHGKAKDIAKRAYGAAIIAGVKVRLRFMSDTQKINRLKKISRNIRRKQLYREKSGIRLQRRDRINREQARRKFGKGWDSTYNVPDIWHEVALGRKVN